MNLNRQRQIETYTTAKAATTEFVRTFGRCGWLIGLICVTCILADQDLQAQTINGGGIGGNVDTGGFGNTGNNLGGTGTGTGTGNTGNNTGGAFGDNIGNVLGNADTTDQRNQGFVGSAGTRITESGFVGPPGEETGPPLAEGATFGGGVNDVGTNGGAGGGGGNRGNTGFGGVNQPGGVGGTGVVKGFEINRSNVRSILRPSFATPQVFGEEVASRFQNRITRQPDMSADGANVQISVQNQTATMQGFVQSEQEADRIERQLRLEPGIYRIDNRVQIIEQ